MAKLAIDIDDSVLKDISYIDKQFDHIFGGMTKAGAEVVYKNVISALPEPLRSSGFSSHVKLSKVYKTPSDDGINTKVMITGYFINKDGRKTPAPLVANMFEYGSDKRNYPKQPFFRKSFKKSQIMKAMEEEQKKLSGGLLDE
nr:MAG: virion morphogenesis family protein [Bacteriophage sp.]